MEKAMFRTPAGVALLGCVLGAIVGFVLTAPGPPRVHLLPAEHYDSAAEMTAAMDLVVVADIVESRPGRFVDDLVGGIQFTETTFRIHETISGPKRAGDRFVLEHTIVESGRWFAFGRHAHEAYADGARHLLMLRQQPDTEMYMVANPQGRFAVDARGFVSAPNPDLPVARELDGRAIETAAGFLRSLGRNAGDSPGATSN